MSRAVEARLRIPHLRQLAGLGLVALGVLLMAGAVTYATLGAYGRSQLDRLVVPGPAAAEVSLADLQRDLVVFPKTEGAEPVESAQAELTGAAPAGGSSDPARSSPPAGQRGSEGAATEEEVAETPAEQSPRALALPRPGTDWNFQQLRAEATSASSGSLLGGRFEPVDWATLPLSVGALPEPTRIQVPAIGLDSRVVPLETQWEGKQLVWETAVYAVGYHRGSARPGERGNAVFSGHISSPISREGAIFRRLPEVAGLLREGRTVDIVVEAGGRRYLYRAISTDVREPDDLDVFRPAHEPSLSLVTCVPDGFYTHRLMVNAVLVGVAAAS